jgi:hypothetical protein
MQAFQLIAWQKPAELREVPVPEPGPGQVLVQVGGAGACHSDLHLMEAPADGRRSSLPFTLGHENAGWVEKLGPGATGFAPRDPVIVYGPWGCGICANCRAGMENSEPRPRRGRPEPLTGVVAPLDAGAAHATAPAGAHDDGLPLRPALHAQAEGRDVAGDLVPEGQRGGTAAVWRPRCADPTRTRRPRRRAPAPARVPERRRGSS